MPDQEPTKEERILRMVKRVLTEIAKETYTRPGYRHPLSDGTVNGIRDCLALISARESELAEEAGRPMKMRPRFVDEPQTSVVVPLEIPGKKDRNTDQNG
jgi:hypothetical protein